MILKHEDRINMTNNLISEQDKEKIYSLVLKYVKKYPNNLTNTMKENQKKLSEEEFKKYIAPQLMKHASDDAPIIFKEEIRRYVRISFYSLN